MRTGSFKHGIFITAVIFVMAACGCIGPKPVTLDTKGVTPAVATGELAMVLQEAVDDAGRVDFEVLATNREVLLRQLRRLAVTGPTATATLYPTHDDRIAYWYNARAAWAMYLSLQCKDSDNPSRRRLETRAFPLDGRKMTLEKIDAILAADKDWRTLVASPGVRLDRALLPSEPFSGDDIRRRIDRRFQRFIDDERRFVIDVAHRRVLVPAVLWRFHKRIIDEHNTTYRTEGTNLLTALLPYTHGSPHRRLQDAVGYTCVPAERCGLACPELLERLLR